MNVGTLIAIGELLGEDDWRSMNPSSGPKVLATYLTVLVAQAEQVPIEAAMQVVFGLSPDDLLDTMTVE